MDVASVRGIMYALVNNRWEYLAAMHAWEDRAAWRRVLSRERARSRKLFADAQIIMKEVTI